MTRSAAHFDRTAERYAGFAAERPEFRERFALWRSRIDRAPRVAPHALDLGCGPGDLAFHLALRGYRTTAVDGSGQMLKLTQGRLTQLPQSAYPVELRQARLPLAEMPIEWRSHFGVIVLSSVLEYLEDPATMMRQCRAMLVPGGTLIVSFPNASSVYWKVQSALRSTPMFRHSDSLHQQHRQTVESARALGESNGLVYWGTQFFALPIHRHLSWLGRRRPPWLATLLLAEFRAPADRTAASG